jgi:UDP-N-acetylglucosamine:LPS N-acetylglucosamine transferase
MDRRLRCRIAVVSGSYGAGHDAVAAEVATRLLGAGAAVTRHDIAGLLACRTGQALRWTYLRQLRMFPETWGATLTTLGSDNRASRTTRTLLSRLGARLLGEVSAADLVISTHPFASQVLGSARAAGALTTPVVTYLTDASVHRLWVHAGVDLHLAIHEVAALQARAMGARVEVVDPVVPTPERPTFGDGWSPPWPVGDRVALVVGGSQGIGRLEDAARDVLATRLMTPVVACGSNRRLHRRLSRVPGVTPLGWRTDLQALMAAADCVIQNAGGMSSLEALAARTPTLTYLPIPGHGHENALALDRAGLVPHVRDAAALEAALGAVLQGRRRRWSLPQRGGDLLDLLAGLLPRPTTAPPELAA